MKKEVAMMMALILLTTVAAQPPEISKLGISGGDYHFDVQTGGKEFIFSSTPRMLDGRLIRIPTPLNSEVVGYAPIFGRKSGEFIFTAVTKNGSRAVFSQSGKAKAVQLTTPSAGAIDYSCSLSNDKKRLFFLRSSKSRTTSMGGRALGDIDLWTKVFKTGKEMQLTHLSMFSARLSPRCGVPGTVFIVSNEKSQPKTRLLGVSLNDLSISVVCESNEDIGGYSVSSDFRSIFYSTGDFPVSLFQIPLQGGSVKKLGEFETMSELVAEGKALFFLSFKYGGTNYGISKLDLATHKVSSITGSVR